jgi:hypothetical protein
MKKKNQKDTKILSETEVKLAGDAIKKLLGENILEYAQKASINIEDTIRFHSVASKCREQRESRNLTLKDVGLKLKVPQYKLRFIENGSLRNIDPKILYKYLIYLEINDWFQNWLESNPEYSSKFSIDSDIF